MSRDKQTEIHELAKKMSEAISTEVEQRYIEDEAKLRAVLIENGWRKASDVAEEIFAEIEHTARAAIILLKFEKDEKLRNTKTECYEDLLGYIAELKKKYTEEGK